MYVSDLIAGVKDLDHIQIFEDLVHKKELKTFIGHRPVEKLKRAVAGAHGLRAYKLALHNEG